MTTSWFELTPRRYWATALTLAVAVSVAGNIGHALLTATSDLRLFAAAAAALPPLALLLVTEGLMRTAGHGRRRWAYAAGVAGAVAIAALAFVLSFTALRELAIALGQPEAVAAGWPLLADATIAVSSVMLLATKEPEAPRADRQSLPQRVRAWWRGSPTAPAATTAPAPTIAPELAYPASLTWMTAPATAPVPITGPVAATASVVADRTQVTQVPETSHHPAAIPVTSADEAVVDPAPTATTETATVKAPVIEPSTTAERPAATAVEAPATTARALQLVADAPAVDMPAATADHHAAAAELVADGVFKAGREERLATALALIEARPEMSQREIARLAGVDRTVVKKLLDARMTVTA
ncbi:DUF2637 domain-containing protein [Tsukamurella tyrosinosolvens]|uniref:DUF2637 domain-containing protein n=1 Tax=Tsukamurella tyrosinosolvens TaxID=57704 RepID=UPI003F4A84C8